MFAKICHYIITCYYTIFVIYGLKMVFFYDLENASDMFKKTVVNKNPFMYFSVWGLVFQSFYFLFVSYLEYTGITLENKDSPLRERLENIRKNFFMSLVFPITIFIGITFWTFFLYDRELIYPEVLDKEVPPLLNHACHTVPPVLVFLHLVIADQSDINTTWCIVILSTVQILYTLCFIWSGMMYGNWIYLMYDVMSAEKIALIFIISYIIACLSFALGRKISLSLPKIKDKVQEYKKLN